MELIKLNKEIMKKILIIIIVFIAPFFFSSCLESGLDELPAYSDADISSFKFEYRWYNEANVGNLVVTQMKVATKIDKENQKISCEITVPNVSNTLPAEQREKLSLKNLVGYCDVSTAAIVSPVGDSPTLGKIGDFSGKNLQYKVTAADGSSKVWTLEITKFTK